METLEARLARLAEYIDSPRFALTEADVRYDYASGNHRYASDARKLRAKLTPGMVAGTVVWDPVDGWADM